MDWKLEVVVVPVADVDRSYEFYVDKLGFTLDTDHRAGDAFRVVQVTPPGSACPQHFGEGGVMVAGSEPTRADYVSFIFFDDPDGNTWAVQEIRQHVR